MVALAARLKSRRASEKVVSPLSNRRKCKIEIRKSKVQTACSFPLASAQPSRRRSQQDPANLSRGLDSRSSNCHGASGQSKRPGRSSKAHRPHEISLKNSIPSWERMFELLSLIAG